MTVPGAFPGTPFAPIYSGMSTAIVILLIVIALVAGTVISLRTTAKTGMPSKEVLDRATQRSREIEAREKDEQANRRD
jgi:hypothetical protein